ncbi:MAG: mechanosensitive ion channel domain-containing protein, partial [Actinomycetota bacterium]
MQTTARPALTTLVEPVAQADEVTTTDVDVVCGNQGPLCEALYEWSGNELLAEAVSFVVGAPLRIILIAVVALVLNRVARRGIRRITDRLGTVTAEHGDAVVDERSVARAEERARTIGSLLRSLSTAVIYGGALVLMLESLGLGVITVIAGAGVLGLAIGFGAQSVVEDLLRGVFMLAEDQFGVGDRIDVGMVNGHVERVTLRTTVIRDSAGTLWHVPNSEIDHVANEAQLTSRAAVEIGVSYSTDLDEAMRVLERAAVDAAAEEEWSPVVDRPPAVSGVEALGDDAVAIRVVVWVDAGERRRFERHLRRRLKQAVD